VPQPSGSRNRQGSAKAPRDDVASCRPLDATEQQLDALLTGEAATLEVADHVVYPVEEELTEDEAAGFAAREPTSNGEHSTVVVQHFPAGSGHGSGVAISFGSDSDPDEVCDTPRRFADPLPTALQQYRHKLRQAGRAQRGEGPIFRGRRYLDVAAKLRREAHALMPLAVAELRGEVRPTIASPRSPRVRSRRRRPVRRSSGSRGDPPGGEEGDQAPVDEVAVQTPAESLLWRLRFWWNPDPWAIREAPLGLWRVRVWHVRRLEAKGLLP